MKTIQINKENLRQAFTNYDIYSLAIDCIDRINASEVYEETLYEELTQAIDDTIIYTSDQWLIIGYYSDTTNPIDIFVALSNFAKDIYTSITLEN